MKTSSQTQKILLGLFYFLLIVLPGVMAITINPLWLIVYLIYLGILGAIGIVNNI